MCPPRLQTTRAEVLCMSSPGEQPPSSTLKWSWEVNQFDIGSGSLRRMRWKCSSYSSNVCQSTTSTDLMEKVNHREHAKTGLFMIFSFRQHSFTVGLYQRQWRPLQGPGNLEINFLFWHFLVVKWKDMTHILVCTFCPQLKSHKQVKRGAILGTMNKANENIFNCPVATKQLLFRCYSLNIK